VTASGVSSVTVAGRAPTAGECDLCARGATTLPATVVIQQATGAGVRMDACEYCARALRRLAATTAGVVRFVDGGPGPRRAPLPGSVAPLPRPGRGPRGAPQTATSAGEPLPQAPPSAVLLEYPHAWSGPDGVAYRVRACGAPREDGTWTGWVEFWAPDGAVWRTPRETTQPNRGALEYWASGLQPTYFEGALARARPPAPRRRPA
jgi:hypothetical protein